MHRLPPYVIPAGDLRQPITIQAPSSSPNEFGEPQTSWTTVLTTRAKIEAITLREQFQQGSFASQITHRITIRYPGSAVLIKPGYQVLYTAPEGVHTFKIQALDNVNQRNRAVQILALELDGAQ